MESEANVFLSGSECLAVRVAYKMLQEHMEMLLLEHYPDHFMPERTSSRPSTSWECTLETALSNVQLWEISVCNCLPHLPNFARCGAALSGNISEATSLAITNAVHDASAIQIL